MIVIDNQELSLSLLEQGIDILPRVDAYNINSEDLYPLPGESQSELNSNDSSEFDITTDLILDFDGGSVQAGDGYDIPLPEFSGFEFAGFTPFSTIDNSPGNANEQILQIVAGVREDYADFNVNVIWDDRGVDSPHYDNNDTVINIVDNSIRELIDLGPDFDDLFILGIAANVDVPEFTGDSSIQSRRDTGFVFLPPFRELFGPFGAVFGIREVIDTISHEAGHTFGLSHASEPDSENRQLVTNIGNDIFLDSRFSPEPLNHDAPEVGVIYSEVDRLNEAVGPASVLPGDTQSSQTLLFDPTVSFLGVLGSSDVSVGSGEIDFLGDRDAFVWGASTAGDVTIIQSSNDSSLTPVVTLWNFFGNFESVGNVGSDGVSSTIVNVSEDDLFRPYYAIAGSEADRQPSGMLPDPQTGAYDLFVVAGAFENNQIGSPLDDILTGDGQNNFIAGKSGDDLLKGGGGNDRLLGDADNDTLNGGFGEDTLEGGDGDDLLKGNRDDDLLLGEAGDDRLVGQGGDDTLLGGEGDDRLWGEAGDDSLDGGAGDDFILGWKGDDTIRGGSGRDIFVFAPDHGTDTIADFTVGEDSIGLKDGLSVTDLSVSVVNGDTEIALRGIALAILENQSLSAADIDFISV